jgi:diketogulonate reductase-like aldo/keto reductase
VVPASAADTSERDLGGTAEDIVTTALDAGYRFFDCAEFYANEASIGRALAKSSVPRTDLFLCSKVWTSTIAQGPDAVKRRVLECLAELQVDYVDLMLIHWPVPSLHTEAYSALQEMQALGKIKHLGVSNYTVRDYEQLMGAATTTVAPCANQIEVNPFLFRSNTIRFFQERGVVVQSYRSLRDGKEFDNPVLQAIAAKHGRTVATVLGRWCVQKGVVYIPKSVRRARMDENLRVFDFELDDEDMAVLDGLTTPEALRKFEDSYFTGIVRDTGLGEAEKGEEWVAD